MEWKDGKLGAADIHTLHGTRCQVRYGEKTAAFNVSGGKSIRLDENLRKID